jgi:PAS domain S-box-containing protein
MLDEVARRAKTLQESNKFLEHEIAERRNAEHALRVSERRNRTLLSTITSVVWVADDKGCFVEDLPSWTRYTGQPREVYQGLGWHTAFLETDREKAQLAWARALAAVEPFELECRLWHNPSQQHRYVSLQAVPVTDADKRVHEWIGTVTDIDDQRRAESELRTLNSELEQRVAARTAELETANKELESFSYSVSHDLRAPLRAVSGFARLLREDHGEQLDAEAQRKLDVVLSEARRMGVLIDELLAFSRLGRKALELSDLDMNALARRVYERLRSQHQDSDPAVQIGALPAAPGDRVLLEQVWANLISNALKFSAKTTQPLIEIGGISQSTEHIYYVRDNGAGFDPRYQSQLFGVFQRLHDAKDFQGTGVGLALVQRIVNRHGGRVWAEGKLGEGATFYFTLPKEQADGTV